MQDSGYLFTIMSTNDVWQGNVRAALAAARTIADEEAWAEALEQGSEACIPIAGQLVARSNPNDPLSADSKARHRHGCLPNRFPQRAADAAEVPAPADGGIVGRLAEQSVQAGLASGSAAAR